jgi:glycosyltransferase involved in cell wall biosynthesis
VLASRWEGFGVALVEALQFGLPLLAANCDFGPADIITDPRIGDLVKPESPEAMAEGLKRALVRTSEPGDAEFRRDTARTYDRDEAARMHLDVLSQIARASTARSSRLAALTSA